MFCGRFDDCADTDYLFGPSRRWLASDDRVRELSDRRRFEKFLERQAGLQSLAQVCENFRRQKRVTAQVEEIVMDTDIFNPQETLPDSDDRMVDGASRSDVLGL